MSTMLVTSEDLSGFAMQIKASQSEVQSVFEQLRSRMQYAAGVWQSPASSSLQEQFASLSPVFDSYIQVLENYVQYLNQTAAAYLVDGEGYKESALSKGLFEKGSVFSATDEADTSPFPEAEYKKR